MIMLCQILMFVHQVALQIRFLIEIIYANIVILLVKLTNAYMEVKITKLSLENLIF